MSQPGERRGHMLILGGRDQPRRGQSQRPGWHLQQLIDAARRQNVQIELADYETVVGRVTDSVSIRLAHVESVDGASSCSQDWLNYDAILTRTMPAGTLEQITFRLAALHAHVHRRGVSGHSSNVFNRPASLELAIDKFAALSRASVLGLPTPPTAVCQSRDAAMEAFERLGGDVVVKPVFGGEGRGVMRVREPELAWTTFSTLVGLGSVCYVQQFIRPGGADTRVLVIGERIWGIRRTNDQDFRTNVRGGGKAQLVEVDSQCATWARVLCDDLELDYAGVDFIESNGDAGWMFLEVNAIPGWRGAQSVIQESLAGEIVAMMRERS
ncbi:MAG: RimK family alpha-L-glutamate ligase [Planctomycetota bacterium]